jgi:hypothetical protein
LTQADEVTKVSFYKQALVLTTSVELVMRVTYMMQIHHQDQLWEVIFTKILSNKKNKDETKDNSN